MNTVTEKATAACDPDTIRALLEEMDALRAENEMLRAEVERLKSMTAVTIGVGSGDGNLFVHGDGTPLPRINVKCETVDNGIAGSAFLKVIRVEQEDDGSLTVVIDH